MHCVACNSSESTQRSVGHPACAWVKTRYEEYWAERAPITDSPGEQEGQPEAEALAVAVAVADEPSHVSFILPGCLPNRAWHCISNNVGTEPQRWHPKLWAAVLAISSRSCLTIFGCNCVA